MEVTGSPARIGRRGLKMTIRDCMAQGSKAWDDGLRRDENPHGAGDGLAQVQRDAWFAGWDYAEMVDEEP